MPLNHKTKNNGDFEHVQDIIEAVPSRGYVNKEHFTPIEEMSRLSSQCDDGPQLYIKRDDMLPLAGGGNKTRKLDYLVQEAMDMGADVLVTSGAVQSNHCRLTASAAAREGLECHLVLEERVPGSYDPQAGGNNYIFRLLGAKTHPAPLDGVEPVQNELVARLESEGKKVYVIPGGGSNELGSLGYARCAAEIIEQSEDLKAKAGEANKPGLFWDAIVLASGSGGTHTGILIGLRAAGFKTPVHGISVRFDSETQSNRIHAKCEALVKKFFRSCDYFVHGMPKEEVIVHDDHVGAGYSLYTEEMAEALQSFARLESIILDPVYTGKAAAGLLSIAHSGEFTKEQKILFLHTGGAPSIYHYQPLPSEVPASH